MGAILRDKRRDAPPAPNDGGMISEIGMTIACPDMPPTMRVVGLGARGEQSHDVTIEPR